MTVRLGVVGTARIVDSGLLRPIQQIAGMVVTTVASRDRSRAEAFARTLEIPHVAGSYGELFADPDIDAVYVATPVSTHAEWTRRAISEGKHVLVEKPMTVNAGQAKEIALLADRAGVVVMEAMHSRHHPLWSQLRALISAGEIGKPLHASASFTNPHSDRSNIRWDSSLGGGALLDLGIYAISLLDELFGIHTVQWATATVEQGVDAVMKAGLVSRDAIPLELYVGMAEDLARDAHLSVLGSRGELDVLRPYHPQHGGLITITNSAGTRSIEPDRRATYVFMLSAFRDAIVDGAAVSTDPHAAVRTLSFIDAIYDEAGLSAWEPSGRAQFPRSAIRPTALKSSRHHPGATT